MTMRMTRRRLAALMCVVAIAVTASFALRAAPAGPAGQSFMTLAPGDTQELIGVTNAPLGQPAMLPSGDLLVTEKPGRIRIVSAAGKIGEPIAGVPAVDDRGQGGLLDVALAPDFAGFRSAVCRGERTATLDASLVRALRAALSAAS